MADGSFRPIEEIRPGDRVRSWHLQWGVLAEGCVERVLTGAADSQIRLNGRLAASPAHRILSTRGYLRFDEVEPGDLLLRSSGSPEPVSTVEVLPWRHCVHNLVVVPHASFIAEGCSSRIKMERNPLCLSKQSSKRLRSGTTLLSYTVKLRGSALVGNRFLELTNPPRLVVDVAR
jgi:hypothetical protein